MSAVKCGNCSRPSPDGGEICTTCTVKLARQLRGVPDLVEDLLTTMARLDRISAGGPIGSRGAESVLPVKLHVPEEIWVLGNVLTTWARDLAETAGLRVDARSLRRPVIGVDRSRGASGSDNSSRCDTSELPVEMCAHCRGDRPPQGLQPDQQLTRVREPARRVLGWRPPSTLDSLRFAAAWLAEHIHELRRSPDAVQAWDEIIDCLANARRVIDRRAVLAFRGPCQQCGKELYAPPKAATITCRGCGEQHDGPALRSSLLDEAADQLVTATELSAALTALADDTPVKVGTIYSWHSRGQLTPRAWLHDRRFVMPRPLSGSDQPLFNLGDARELANQLQAKNSSKAG